MQLSALQIVNAANGQTANAVFTTPRVSCFTVSTFEHHYDMDGQEIPKFQASGQWQNYEFVRRMLIHQEGKIVGTTNADLNWQRRNLLLAALTDAGNQPLRWHATLYVTPAGHPQLYARVVLVDSTLASTVEQSNAQDYMLQWRNDYGYWRKVSDDTIYKI